MSASAQTQTPPDFYQTTKDYGPIVVVPVLFFLGSFLREVFDLSDKRGKSSG